MSLGLDLTAARSKVSRAIEHTDTLDSELTPWCIGNPAYSFRFSAIDRATGWCSMFLVPTNVSEPRFGVIFGDVVHNLRSALDYVVSALVEASGATLTTRHQFPIFIDAAKYQSEVGPVASPRPKGPLGGVVHGVGLIEQLQPYKRHPEPRADQLWAVHRFSNADKHRQTATRLPIPLEGPLDITFDGTLVEKDETIEIPNWVPEEESEIARLRFDPPVVRNLRAIGRMSMAMLFVTGPFGPDPDPIAIEVASLRETCDYVGTVVEQFETL